MTEQTTVISGDTIHNCEQHEVPAQYAKSRTDGERTLVTFAIFAYNQEKYIHEAVEGAFAQTYEPMEIILSDDCSTDRTFEIMKEMASTYKGTKKIVTHQAHSNRGTLLHVADVASIAAGELIVVAHGDDISKKERTKEIVTDWLSTDAWGIYSKFDRINENGKIISESEDPRMLFSSDYRLRHYLSKINAKAEIVFGPVSAYDKRIFHFLDVTKDDYILSEDGVLSVLLNMLGKEIKMINKSLVSYRENEQSTTNCVKKRKISFKLMESDELKIERFARSHANRCELFIRWNNKLGMENRELNTKEILDDLIKHRMRYKWRSTKLREKLIYLKNNFNNGEMKWALPRILPMTMFFSIKALMKKII